MALPKHLRYNVYLITVGSTITVYLSRPLRPTQPGHPSVGGCNEYQRWFRPSLGRNDASKVTTLWRFI